MKIEYFVNAMIVLGGRDTRVLCDPWVTFGESSSSGLYNFPPLALSRADVAAIAPDFIYISHTHADHLDPDTLSLFPRSTPILVAPFANNFTERNIRKLGFTDVRVVPSGEGLALNGADRCWLEPSATYPEVDSIGVFRIDGRTAVNANDNPFHEAQCRDLAGRFGRIDLCCVPFGFQGPYPAFYENLAPEARKAAAEAKKLKNYAHLAGYAKVLRPERVFAFAGGAIYGGPKALLHPYYGVGTAEEAVRIAQAEAPFEPVMLSECCSFDLETGLYDGEYRPRDYASERAYVSRIAGKPDPFTQGGIFWVAPEARIDLAPLLTRAREKQLQWAARTGRRSEAVYFLDVGDGPLYRVSLVEPGIRRVDEASIADPRYEIFRLPYPLLIGLLTGHFNWSNVKTQFVSFCREPDVFDRDLHVLMSYLQV